MQRCGSLLDRKKEQLFNPTNENPSYINILVTCMGLALTESIREHFLFSVQKIHVTLVMQYLDQEFWGKLMSFWLFRASSSSLSTEGRGWEGVLEVLPELWCRPGLSWARVPVPPSPAARGKQGRHEAAGHSGRPRWI